MNKKVAWTHPVYKGFVLFADGYQLSKNEAESLGYAVEAWPADQKRIEQHPYKKDLLLSSRGLTLTPAQAATAGFTVAPQATNVETLPETTWRSSLMSIAEGRTRPSALAEILHTQSSASLPFESARAFLRGLPHEQPEGPEAVTTASDPKATRLAEIDASMATFNKNNNVYRGKKPAAVVSSLSVTEPLRLKRLAEIRLGAITTRLERGESALSGEQKKLAYALSVHDQTGLPLATVFTQLGVDTSIMLKESTR
ncbi:hypothetical protein [Tardiphaga sp. vice278]|uniref:hypothetical protein n=1 Tax=Tardiphaga sp. vice278 TaxID=2592815 RepID=UPI0011644197|nr:hypothetical protein [Tardiphaga sp. vice278]QDM17550.1 hypothetical protein FNL53_17580 [Tardiphaga sp. vice278]